MPDSECWNWDKRCLNGYGILKLKGKTRLMHRVMYELFVGRIPRGLMVCHKCDNRRCINPMHLFLGTAADNQRDAAIKNLKHHKLSIRNVLEIRRLRIEGFKQVELAKMFGINQSQVSRIVSKKRRQHL